MTDLAHLFGSDLSIAATGDLATVSDTDQVQQRVYRRLLTARRAHAARRRAAGGYLWAPTYGSGLPAMVGAPVSPGELQAIVSEQMALEAAVDQTQPIGVAVETDNLGTVVLTISYTDAATGQPASFALT